MECDGSYGLLAACGRDRKGHSPIEVCKVIPVVYLWLVVEESALRLRDLPGPSGVLGESSAQSSEKKNKRCDDAFHFEILQKPTTLGPSLPGAENHGLSHLSVIVAPKSTPDVTRFMVVPPLR